jgi:NADPH:quinone reductase-like Zn-dependent oxidoreductase
MKAVVYTKYGSPDVLEVKELEKPVPKDGEVLVEVRAAALNAADWHLLRADPFLVRLMVGGLLEPKHTILGGDVAGRVVAVGPNAKRFKPGDEVFGDTSGSGFGAFAEYVCANENALVLKPAKLSFEQAAAVPMAAVTALQALRDKGKLQPGQKVLINGASGGVGTYAVQLARALGAEVTAVCSPGNVEKARSLGANHVIDYTKEDFTKSGQRYDLILAANGYHSLLAYKRALNPGGIYIMTGGSNGQMYQTMLLGPLISLFGNNKMSNTLARPNQADLVFLSELLEAGKVVPVIDRCYRLSEVADAMRYLEEGHAKGKIVIAI